jgi:hypothetical protein
LSFVARGKRAPAAFQWPFCGCNSGNPIISATGPRYVTPSIGLTHVKIRQAQIGESRGRRRALNAFLIPLVIGFLVAQAAATSPQRLRGLHLASLVLVVAGVCLLRFVGGVWELLS